MPYGDAFGLEQTRHQVRDALGRHGGHRGLRAAVPAFDRPAAQGRAELGGRRADRAALAARRRWPIPGFDYDFATLIDAQAIGDHQSLVATRPACAARRGRRLRRNQLESMRHAHGDGRARARWARACRRRLLRAGHEVVGFDVNPDCGRRARSRRRDRRRHRSKTPSTQLDAPRVVWLMLPGGPHHPRHDRSRRRAARRRAT